VEGIKNLGGELSEMMEGRVSGVMEARFAQDANQLVATLSRRLRAVRCTFHPLLEVPCCPLSNSTYPISSSWWAS